MVKVYYGSLQTQSSTTSSATQSRVVGFNQLISAFSQFGSSYEDLLGEGYDAARIFANGIMVPYYKGCILYSEAVGDSANKLADDYSATCGAEDLDEEKLRAEIDSAGRGCMSLSASISGLQSKSKPAEGDAQRIASLQNQLALAESKLREAQDKLDKLLQFNANSATACDSANTYAFYMNKAQIGISASFSGGNFNMPSDLSWVEIVEQGWENREIALSDAYTKAVEKVYSGEELTEADLTAIERYSREYPEYVDPTVLNQSKEIRTLKSEEMSNRSLINKVENGQILNDNEVKSLQEYNKKYPNGILSGKIQGALEDNELNKKKKIESKSTNTKKTTESKKSLWDSIVDFGTGVVDYVSEHVIGYENTVSIETPKNNQNHGVLYSTYDKETVKISKKKSGLINIKTENGHFSGVGIDLGFYNTEIGVEDGHLNWEQEANILGYKGGSKVSVGVNPDTGLEINAAAGVGKEKDGKSDMNYLGLKVSTDIQDGILGGYAENVQSETSGDSVKTISTEAGFQTINMYEAGAVATLVGLYFAWELLPVLAPYAQKVGEMVQNSGLSLIPQAQ